MSGRQVRTLRAVFAAQAPVGLPWAAIESLLIAAGCGMIGSEGSRVRFVGKRVVVTFHRPHPGKEAKRYQVRDARDFLVKIGVTQ